ncbi:ATP-dependent DNA ligase [Pseudomonas syringae]|uniref:ATP-dependent DNA ligase n=1 Tax=Pseudomonas syringae TaxID=317 RepID=A0A1C7Z0N8_PSESX|nr:DNA ligase D [Pseudomonas syringae]OCR23491.1 ATP-dependent DNA ligase [Pseudomonas syringae]
MAQPVSEYARKRNFDITSEPAESPARAKGKDAAKALSFVIHKHDARNLHYDFRLELGGTLKSWAVPKGPSLDPANKRLAVQVEDHPLGYANFEGSIPEGQYGAGDVIVWDRGIWQPHGDPRDTYKQGKLKFTLVGEKLTGDWTLVRTRLKGSSDKPQWLLIKEKDQVARSGDEYDIVQDQPQSVVSGALVGKEKSVEHPPGQPAKAKRKTSAASPNKTASAKPAKSAKSRIDVAGVSISHPDRVIDAESGIHKVDLAHYYATVADRILPHLKNRPVALLRCPEGVEGEQFFQKHAERLKIPNIKQLKPGLDPGHARLMEIDTVQALVGAAQMGTIELHRWGASSDRIETPDHIVLDLDPDDKLPWRSIIEATQMTLSALDELGLEAFIKTSGGKGMHIIVPLARQADWDTVKAFAKAIAEFISQQLPERFTATMGPKNRVGKVFIDYLRNTRGASTVVAYSARARPGLPVSVPVARDELEGLTSARQWNVSNLQERLRALKTDPWAGYQNRQRITKKMWVQLGQQP